MSRVRVVPPAILRRGRDERGSSLVFSLLTVLVISVTLASVVQFTTANSNGAGRSEADQIAYRLAETGINNAAAVLSNPNNDALSQSLLPSAEPNASNPSHAAYIAEYEGGTAKWWGVLTGSQWLIHGVGIVSGPSGGTSHVRREVTSTIKIQPTLTQDLNNNAFNYMFAKSTSAPCDVTFMNGVAIDTSLFILGDLCFQNSSSIVKAAAPNVTALVVGQHVHFSAGSSGSVGTSSAKIKEAHIAGGCRVGNPAPSNSPTETWTACSSSTRIWADTVDAATVVNDGGPVADFNFWYANAKPGPAQYCSTKNGSPSGISTQAFEATGSTTMSPAAGPYSAASFNLTPTTDYTCRFYDVPPLDNDLLGELSWKASTKTLTIKGVIFIDGSAYVTNNATNTYVGLGTLYLAGTFTINGSAQLCGAVSAGTCSFTNWDPNAAMLGIMANGQDASGWGVKLQNQAQFQGSIYATANVLLENYSVFDGPIVANTFSVGNNVVTHEFPALTTVPIGWPGNPTVYAEPQPPQNYSG